MSDPIDIAVVGGGPAGMMAGLLFARAGLTVRVLEKHRDFLRDFRGDTVHPSTMEILAQLGLLERFLQRPHHRLSRARIRVAEREWEIGDLSHLATPAPFIAMMPQWDFLDFLRDAAAAYPSFLVNMDTPVADVIDGGERISGVQLADGQALHARLVIAADGRDSLVRTRDLLPVKSLGAPMDVLWFRLPKSVDAVAAGEDALRGSVATGRLVVLIDRGDYWQTAFVVAKGSAETVRRRGVGWVLDQVRLAFPDLTLADDALASADELKLLKVGLDRLARWHRPGLLAIGDAAHTMSPIGGIGINLAIQDAVAAANILAGPMARGHDPDPHLARVQARRSFPTRVIQAGQRMAQDNIIDRVLDGAPITRAPLAVRLLDRFPLLRRIPGRLIGLGVRRERVRSPAVSRPAAEP